MLQWLRSAPIACALLLQLLVLFPFSGLLSCGTRSGYSIFITLLIDNARGLDSWPVFSVVLVFPYPQSPKGTGPSLTVSSIMLGSVSDEVCPHGIPQFLHMSWGCGVWVVPLPILIVHTHLCVCPHEVLYGLRFHSALVRDGLNLWWLVWCSLARNWLWWKAVVVRSSCVKHECWDS